MIGTIVAVFSHLRDVKKRTSTVNYHLTEGATEQLKGFREAISVLSKSQAVWRGEPRRTPLEWSRHEPRRHKAFIRRSDAPFIKTNVDVWGIDLGGPEMFFFPDRLLMWESKRYSAYPYESIEVRSDRKDFTEWSGAPRDAEIVSRVWQHSRVNGGPDRRFARNRSFPVAAYGTLTFKADPGLDILLYVSNRQLASRFAQGFKAAVATGNGNSE
jgi:hypothetical protein